MASYFAHISHSGPVKCGDVPGAIGVLEALDRPMPISEAHCVTWDENRLGVWMIRLGKEEIPGRWIGGFGLLNETAGALGAYRRSSFHELKVIICSAIV
jgi:hypothetical protein